MTQNSNFLAEDTVNSLGVWHLLSYARQWRIQFIVAITFLILSSVSVAVSAYLFGMLVSTTLSSPTGILAGNASIFLFSPPIISGFIAIITLEFFSVFTLYLGRRDLAINASKVLYAVRKALFEKLSILPLSYLDRQPLGRTVTRMAHDVEGLEEFFGSSLARIVICFINVTTVIVSMLWIDVKLGGFCILSMIPAALVTMYSRHAPREMNRDILKKSSAINARLSEYLKGMHVVRSFGLEEWSKERFEYLIRTYLGSALALNRFFAIVRPLGGLAATFPLLVTLIGGGYWALLGVLPLGTLVTFVRLCDRFSRPIQQLSQELQVIQTAFTCAERVASMLRAPTEIEALGNDGTFAPEKLRGEIQFSNVTLQYDAQSTPALSDVSFTIQPGEHIGLAGRTGSGKTSTVSLLARLYEFQHGDITIDGRSIKEYSRTALRRAIGFVSQDPVLFFGTVQENLANGEPHTRDEILGIAKKTGLVELLSKKGMGLDSTVLDGGANLSAGERQVLSLTRVLLQKASILIFDEATAQIDEATEKQLHQTIEELAHSLTCLFIAHRLDTLKSCSRLFVFRSGELVEAGSHAELVAKDGYYSQLTK